MRFNDYLQPPRKAVRLLLARMMPGRRMSLLAIILLAAILQSAANSYAQKVTFKAGKTTLPELFREVRKQTGFSFLYSDEIVKGIGDVAVDLQDASLEETMRQALNGKPLTYSVNNKTIILRRAPVKQQTAATAAPVQEEVFEIKGRLVDGKTKEPIPGATIVVVGTTTGVISNNEGNFTLRVRKGAALQVSFMGYETKLVRVERAGSLQIEMGTTQQSIKDVVVTGIFSRPKANFTGASSSFTAEDLNKVSNGNVLSALSTLDPAFRMPVNINFGSDPNMLPDVVLRGGNSLVDIGQSGSASVFGYSNSPNTPLFILDGFETTLQRINDLDINRIAKVDILKDAAATAIYGSRAANGVIVIETIRPVNGKLRVTYNANLNVEAPDLTGYDLLNAREKLDLEQRIGTYNDAFNYRDEQLKIIYNARRAAVESGVNTDWMALPLRTGIGTKQNIYVEGGGQDALYGVNISYDKTSGVMKGSDRQNITASTYLSYRVKNFQFRNDLTLNFNEANRSPYGNFTQYTRLSPYWAPYDDAGNPVVFFEDIKGPNGVRLNNLDLYDNLDGEKAGRAVNPLYNASMNTVSRTKYQNITNNFMAQWQIQPWLKVVGRLAYSRQADQDDFFRPAQHTAFVSKPTFEKGAYRKSNGIRTSLEGMLTAEMMKNIGKGLIFGTLGTNMQEIASNMEQVTVQGFPNPRLDQFVLGAQFPGGGRPYGEEFRSRLQGFLGNFSYTWDNRYMADVSYRVDGSSQFGSDKRFAPFWSAGLGWNLHNENILRGSDVINRLKLRYSIGTTGSQNFPSFQGVTTSQYFATSEYRGLIGTRLMGYGNNGLVWQKTLKNNLGADITLFNRLNITANYFVERTQGSIGRISLQPSAGFDSYADNMGDVLGKGWEVNARFDIINNPAKRNNWSIFVNALHVKSTIEKVSNTIAALNKRADTTLSSKPLVRYAEGQSVKAIWVVPSLGIDPSTGVEIYRKRDGSLTNTYDPLDQVIYGDEFSKVEGTFGTNAEISGIGLNLYFRYRYGGQAYNQTLIDRVENVAANLYNVDRRVYEERWTKPGDVTFFKGIVNASGFQTGETRASSRFVQDYNELICESLSVYYRFSNELNRRLRVQNTKITLFTGDLFRLSSIKRERGLDYPFARNFTLQLQTSF